MLCLSHSLLHEPSTYRFANTPDWTSAALRTNLAWLTLTADVPFSCRKRFETGGDECPTSAGLQTAEALPTSEFL